jgi:hypothetical protein
MRRYIYLSLTPEALIASMLPPNDFGTYMAVGSKKKSRGQALFFEVDPATIHDILPLDYIEKRCVPNDRGEPKRSVYLSIYRVLESIPLKALKNLYLVTNDGRVLELKTVPHSAFSEEEGLLHLYQELGPVFSRIASSLTATRFMKFMTDKTQYTSVPKLVFVEMNLNGLAANPEKGSDENLPYPNMDHLRDCLLQLKQEPGKLKKTILRSVNRDLLYRTCTNGFFVGTKSELLFYPFPSQEELNDKYHVWWRSANSVLL